MEIAYEIFLEAEQSRPVEFVDQHTGGPLKAKGPRVHPDGDEDELPYPVSIEPQQLIVQEPRPHRERRVLDTGLHMPLELRHDPRPLVPGEGSANGSENKRSARRCSRALIDAVHRAVLARGSSGWDRSMTARPSPGSSESAVARFARNSPYSSPGLGVRRVWLRSGHLFGSVESVVAAPET